MALNREELRGKLLRREIAPVYVLYGPETYLRDLAAKTIADIVLQNSAMREFNDSEFSLNVSRNLTLALAAAEQLPMMSEKRVVRITDVRISASGPRDTLKEDEEAALMAYLRRPSMSSVVVFVADELNGTRKMSKLLKANTEAVEFAELDDAELARWARSKFKEAGSEIGDRELQHLIKLVGRDVRRLTNEIAKVVTAALPDKQVGLETIVSLVAHSRELTNFELTDHLVAGRKGRALEALKKILDDGAEPLALLGLISYNFRRLLLAKDMMMQGIDRREVSAALKMRYSDQEPFLAAARRADISKLKHAILSLAKTDLAIKTSLGGGGPIGTRMQIEMLVCELGLL